MGNELALRSVRRAAWLLAGWQLLLTLLVAALMTLAGGERWFWSALAGGGIGILAGLYQALRMLRVDASEHPERYMGSVYVSEALKIVLTVALFIAAIKVLKVELVPVMVTYAVTLSVYWAALRTNFPWQKGTPAGDADSGQGGE
jgi:ATP synthase protein I